MIAEPTRRDTAAVGLMSTPERDQAVELCRGLRVLECGHSLALSYAGWLLAGMGAQVDRLDGCSSVAQPPAHAERALPFLQRRFAHLDRAKTVRTIRPDCPFDPQMLQIVDVLLVDDSAWFERVTGNPLMRLRQLSPHLAVVCAAHMTESLAGDPTPYSGLDAQAVSAVVQAVGEADRSPLPLPPGFLDCQLGANVVCAALLMRVAQARGAKGADHAEVALSDVLTYYTWGNALGMIPWGLEWRRAGSRCSASGGSYPYVLLPCRDGMVCLICRGREEWQRFVQLMGNPEWAQQPRYQDLRAMGTQYPDEVDALIRPWLSQFTRAELMAMSLKHAIPMAPVQNLDEVLSNEQLLYRGAFESLSLAEGSALAPRLPVRLSRPRSMPTAASPVAGAGALGMTRADELARQPLAGLRVLDLGWVWSAPLVAGLLTEFGADVIKVEHGGRMDSMRLRGRPLRDGVPMTGPSIELSPSFHQINHGKRGITLDLKHPDGVATLRRLASKADILIENMSPGALDRVGLNYEALVKDNPGLIMLSMSAAGQKGPGSAMRAYAPVMSSFVGLEGIIGYRGEAPLGALTFGLGDPNAAVHALVAVFAALQRRAQDGLGGFIDLSQIECLLSCLGAQLIDASISGGQPGLLGDAHPDLSPHGVFPAAGDDRWITLVVSTAEQWRALVREAGDALSAFASGHDDVAARMADADAIRAALSRWTQTQDRDLLVARLRARGIAASPVLSIPEMRAGEGWRWRDATRPVTHPITGAEEIRVAPWRFERAYAEIARSSPLLGEHNRAVLKEWLSLSDAEIQTLHDAEVLR